MEAGIRCLKLAGKTFSEIHEAPETNLVAYPCGKLTDKMSLERTTNVYDFHTWKK